MKPYLPIFVTGVATALAAIHGCSSDPPKAPIVQSDASDDDAIVIGVNIALTGTLAAFGKGEQDATRVAQNHINSLGGILGRQVRFEIVDDRTDTAVTKTNMQAFLARRLPVIIGPTGSGQAPDGQKLAAAAFTVLISPSASTPVTNGAEPAKDRYFFRTAASHALQAKAIAIRLFRGFPASTGADAGAREAGIDDAGAPLPGCRKVAIVNQDDAYGNPIAAGITSAMTALGGSTAITVKVPVDPQANYDSTVAQVIAAQADCQAIIAFPAVGAVYMRSFKKAIATDASRDWSTFVSIGSNGMKSEDTLVKGRDNPADPLSPTSTEGIYIMNFDLSPQTPQANEFKTLFQLSAGSAAAADLPGYSANQYDAAILAALAIQRAGTTTDGKKIRDALFEVSRPPGAAFSPAKLADAMVAIRAGQDIDYDGASGPVDFDDYGEVLANFVVFQVNAGKFASAPSLGLTVEDLK
jgi:branched-chain amino acid transport system substrate-binding protein